MMIVLVSIRATDALSLTTPWRHMGEATLAQGDIDRDPGPPGMGRIGIERVRMLRITLMKMISLTGTTASTMSDRRYALRPRDGAGGRIEARIEVLIGSDIEVGDEKVTKSERVA